MIVSVSSLVLITDNNESTGYSLPEHIELSTISDGLPDLSVGDELGFTYEFDETLAFSAVKNTLDVSGLGSLDLGDDINKIISAICTGETVNDAIASLIGDQASGSRQADYSIADVAVQITISTEVVAEGNALVLKMKYGLIGTLEIDIETTTTTHDEGFSSGNIESNHTITIKSYGEASLYYANEILPYKATVHSVFTFNDEVNNNYDTGTYVESGDTWSTTYTKYIFNDNADPISHNNSMDVVIEFETDKLSIAQAQKIIDGEDPDRVVTLNTKFYARSASGEDDKHVSLSENFSQIEIPIGELFCMEQEYPLNILESQVTIDLINDALDDFTLGYDSIMTIYQIFDPRHNLDRPTENEYGESSPIKSDYQDLVGRLITQLKDTYYYKYDGSEVNMKNKEGIVDTLTGVKEECGFVAHTWSDPNERMTYYTSDEGIALNIWTEKVALDIPQEVLDLPVVSITVKGKNLKSVSVPSTVKAIDQYSFRGCPLLETVTFEEGSVLKDLGYNAFRDIPIKNITIPDSVTYIGSYAFAGTSIESITIPVNVESIGSSAFSRSTLNQITFETGSLLESIGSYAFENTPLESITMPANMEYIGNYSFSKSSLKTILFETGSKITDLGYSVLSDIQLENIMIPASVESIQSWLFQNMESLKTVTFEEGSKLRQINTDAFRNTSIESITLPGSVQYIGSYAFADNKFLKTVSIGDTDGLTVAGYAFANCPLLERPTFSPGTYIDYDAFIGSYNAGGYIGDYEGDEFIYEIYGGSGGKYVVMLIAYTKNVSDATLRIGYEDIFVEELGITIKSDEYTLRVKEQAFYYLGGIIGVEFNENVTDIGYRAFYDCYNLVTVKFNGSEIQSIGEEAFRWCELESITLPSTLHNVGIDAFSNASGIYSGAGTTVDIKKEYEGASCYFYYDLFIENDIPLANVSINSGYDGEIAIPNMEKIDDVEYTIVEIETIHGIGSFSIPDTVTKIGSVFDAKSITFGESSELRTMFEIVSENLTEITLPSLVRNINVYTFTHCINLENIYVDQNNSMYESKDGVLFTKDGRSIVSYPRMSENVEFTISDTVTEVRDTIGSPNLSLLKIGANLSTSFSVYQPVATEMLGDNPSYKIIDDALVYKEHGLLYYFGSSETFVVPEGVQWITERAFYGNVALKTVELNSVFQVGSCAFFDCSNLTNVIFGEDFTATSISDGTFYGTAIKEIKIPSSVIHIDGAHNSYGAFENCSKLIKVEFEEGSKINTIDVGAFKDCLNLTAVNYPDTIETVYAQSFVGTPVYQKHIIEEGRFTYELDKENGKWAAALVECNTDVGSAEKTPSNVSKDGKSYSVNIGGFDTVVVSKAGQIIIVCNSMEMHSVNESYTYDASWITYGGQYNINSTSMNAEGKITLVFSEFGYTFEDILCSFDSTVSGTSVIFDPSDIYDRNYINVESEQKQYTLIYDPNGGEGSMDPVTLRFEATYQLDLCTFTKEGHIFMGWSCGDDEYYDGNYVSRLGEGEITLKAIWEPGLQRVMIGYDAHAEYIVNGMLIGNSQEMHLMFGTEIVVDAFSNNSSWSVVDILINGVSVGATTARIIVTEATTIRAVVEYMPPEFGMEFYDKWQPLSSYTTTYLYGEQQALPVAEKSGHTFEGWYDNIFLLGEPMWYVGEFSQGDKIYYGKWTAGSEPNPSTPPTPTWKVESIKLNQTSISINVGESVGLTATVYPTNATNKSVVWETSDGSIASVSNGNVTAHKIGTVTITATTVDGNKVATCIVKVIDVTEEEIPNGTKTVTKEENDDGSVTVTTVETTTHTEDDGNIVSIVRTNVDDGEGEFISSETTITVTNNSGIKSVAEIEEDKDGNKNISQVTTVGADDKNYGNYGVNGDAIDSAIEQMQLLSELVEKEGGTATPTIEILAPGEHIDTPGHEADVSKLTLDAESLRKLSESGADVIVNSEIGKMRLSTDMLGKLYAEADPDITISIERIGSSRLTPEQRDVVRGTEFYDISIITSSGALHKLGGEIEVTLDHKLRRGEDPRFVSVWYVSDAGGLSRMISKYDAQSETVTFVTDHLSVYFVGTYTEPEDNTMLYVAIGIVAIMAIIVIAAVYAKRRTVTRE